tara:strand:- start:317 stop:1165 length:849 start_codon:yes stop_codon:yes gene_type:complete
MVQIPLNEIRTKEILDWKGLHLLHFRGSSCSQKIRIYLNLKNIDWTSHNINLAAGKNYSDWFLGINPKGLIPVLIDDGHVEIESNDILEYLEKKFPEKPLSPQNSQIQIKELLKEEDDLHEDIRNIAYRYMFGGLGKKNLKDLKNFEKYKSLNKNLDQLKMKEVKFYKNFSKEGITDKAVRNSLSKFCICYEKYESCLNNHEYLIGDKLSLLDIAWFIYSYRLFISGFPFEDRFPNVSRWFLSLYSREDFFKEVNDPVIFKLIRLFARISTSLTGKSIKKLL